MDVHEAAALLGVAAYTVTSVEAHDDVWVVTVRNMASHEDELRHLPRAEVDAPAVDVDGDGVPDGTAKQVLAWVGDDAARATLALEAEYDKGDAARSTLVAALEKLVG